MQNRHSNGLAWKTCGGSVHSGDGEDQLLAYAQWAKETELRELRDEIGELKSDGRKPVVQFEDPGEHAKPGEGGSGCKKLEMRIKEMTKELGKIEDFKNIRKKVSSKN